MPLSVRVNCASDIMRPDFKNTTNRLRCMRSRFPLPNLRFVGQTWRAAKGRREGGWPSHSSSCVRSRLCLNSSLAIVHHPDRPLANHLSLLLSKRCIDVQGKVVAVAAQRRHHKVHFVFHETADEIAHRLMSRDL